MELQSNQKSYHSQISRNIQLLKEFLLRHNIIPHETHQEVNFSLAPTYLQVAIDRMISEYLQVCEDLEKNQEPFLNSRRALWSFLKLKKFTFHEDLFPKIEENDCIEIYDLNGIQLFRSFDFFKICSYSIEEILVHPFHELFYREPEISSLVMKQFQEIIEGKLTCVQKPIYPEHWVTELKAKTPRATYMIPGVIAPLKQANNMKAFVHTFQVVSSNKTSAS